MDHENYANYRPISNLSTISKVVERLALSWLNPFLTSSPHFNLLQSAYRTGHSTETALLKVLNDVYKNVEAKAFTVLVALDISAVFDTICHSKLIDRLRDEFEVNGVALSWTESYISGRSQL